MLTVRQLLFPYSPIFLIGVLLAQYGEAHLSTQTLGLLFALLVATAVALAVRFRCLRPLLAALCLITVYICVSQWSLLNSYSLLLAITSLNLLFLLTVEDVLDWEVVGWWAGWMLFEAIAFFGITRYFDQQWRALNLPVAGRLDVALLLGCLACSGMFMKFLLKSDAINAGLLWTALCLTAAGVSSADFAVQTAVLTATICLATSLVERSYWIAYHDELTGVPGRRAFNETIARLDGSYSIALVDIDHFKSFNDTYGHKTGDQVLRKVAAKLRTVGGNGKVFRYGGEEFAIVFPLALDDATHFSDQIRTRIENDTFIVRGPARSQRERKERRLPERAPRRAASVASHVTVSIGVCEGHSRQDVHAVIAKADKALYKAKDLGRNRVVSVPERTAAAKDVRVRAADLI